jgi:toxin CcdB
MAQFDVFFNKDPRSKRRTPYLLDIQSDLLASLATRLVVPLRPRADATAPTIERLHPIVAMEVTPYVAVVSEMAAIPRVALGGRFSSLAGHRKAILDACDLLLTGF